MPADDLALHMRCVVPKLPICFSKILVENGLQGVQRWYKALAESIPYISSWRCTERRQDNPSAFPFCAEEMCLSSPQGKDSLAAGSGEFDGFEF